MPPPGSPRRSHGPPPRPDRIRSIEPGGFAFLPNRFLHDGFLAALTMEERSLYLFLVLAGDRSGVSFYGYDSICSLLRFPLESYLAARDGLIDKDLVAFDGTRFQVLSLPQTPHPPSPRKADRLEHDDPAAIRALLHRELGLKRER